MGTVFSINFPNIAILLLFFVGYTGIIFEHKLKISKTAIALLTAVILWAIHFTGQNASFDRDIEQFREYLGETSQLIFFLLSSMAIVELIDAHHGFKLITQKIQTRSKKKLLWITSISCFFLSAALDNLTTTIVMISLLKKLIKDKEDRWLYGAMIVISANAGGCWTPIGDVTTTMLWIEELINTKPIMQALFFPGLVSLLVSLIYPTFCLKGNFPELEEKEKNQNAELEPHARLIFFLGLAALIFVPVFKHLTGLPVFVGTLLGLGMMWLVTDLLHAKDENRTHLQVPHIFSKIDLAGVLFFLGILLSVTALEITGALHAFAQILNQNIQNSHLIPVLIGIASSVLDNVPLVAATMSMYTKEQFPADSSFWQLIAYCAGTGGSILIIGSAAGVAYMGLEKVDFLWYFKKISLTALVGYLAGVAVYLFL